MTISEFRDYHRVPAYRGHRVRVDGKPGIIAEPMHGYLGVRFDGDGFAKPCHPRWRVEYLDAPSGAVAFGMED